GNNGNGGGANACINNNSDPSPNTIALPRDNCFHDDSCGGAVPNRYGDGDWSGSVDTDADGTPDTGRSVYLGTNYNSAPSALTSIPPLATTGNPTRYDYYLAEIGIGAANNGAILQNRAETGGPQCAPNAYPDPERRVLIAAGVNCTANPINGSATGVPVQEYVKMFITEPVGDDSASPPTLDMWVEVIGTAGGNGKSGSGVFHEVVQLYR
ncbi:MAG: hypothetical protein KDD95_07735, partial [Rhodobacteraceae bacterium]|nr:hypothetical protein [Paracoccaceae bacterium]